MFRDDFTCSLDKKAISLNMFKYSSCFNNLCGVPDLFWVLLRRQYPWICLNTAHVSTIYVECLIYSESCWVYLKPLGTLNMIWVHVRLGNATGWMKICCKHRQLIMIMIISGHGPSTKFWKQITVWAQRRYHKTLFVLKSWDSNTCPQSRINFMMVPFLQVCQSSSTKSLSEVWSLLGSSSSFHCFKTYKSRYSLTPLHALRVDGSDHDHRLLRGNGHGGAPAPPRQDPAGRPAGGHRELLPHHLLRRARPQDHRIGIHPPSRIVPKVKSKHWFPTCFLVRNVWNIMDFVVVVTGYITLLTPEGDAGRGGSNGKEGAPINLRILRWDARFSLMVLIFATFATRPSPNKPFRSWHNSQGNPGAEASQACVWSAKLVRISQTFSYVATTEFSLFSSSLVQAFKLF